MQPTFCAAVSLLVASMALPSARARAQEHPRRVCVIQAPEWRSERANAIRAAFARAFARRGERILTPPPATDPPQLRPRLDAAIATYHQLQPAAALRALDGILEELEASGGGGLTRAGYVRALLHRALFATALDLEDEANEAVDRALGVNPELRPDPEAYPPSLISRVDERRAVGGQPERATLRLLGLPPDARVFIDGALVEDPNGGLRLPVGPHLLRIEAPLHLPHAGSVSVPVGERALEADLAIDPWAILSTSQRLDALIAAANRLGASPFVVSITSLPEGEIALLVDDPATGRRARLTLPGGASPQRVVEATFAALQATRAAGVGAVAGGPTETSTRQRRPLLIGIGVGGAILVGVATSLAIALGASSGTSFVGEWERDVP